MLSSSNSDLDPLAALRWQVDAGADEAIADEPIDRFATSKLAKVDPVPAPSPAAFAAPAAPRPISPEAPRASAAILQAPTFSAAPNGASAEALQSASTLAGSANSLDELRAALTVFEGCGLKKTATNLVFADGNPQARVMFIGEAPGADEDRQGLPFVERHIELIDPAVIVLVGGIAAKTMLAGSEGITKLRGQWHSYETPRMSHPVPIIATFHPAYLLRSPGQKREAWKDLLALQEKMDELGIAPGKSAAP